MKKVICLTLFLFCFSAYSQSMDYNNSLKAINICNAIQGNNFASERTANSALDDILNVIGASKRFVLQECNNINNAVALTMNGVRYIMYDPEFMTSLSHGSNWSKKFILAHEVGHHINGHTVDVLAANSSNRVSLATSRIQELEADEFAGFVLGRLGASLSDALSGVQSLSDEDDSYSTHPRKSKRIAAIKKGFTESGGYVNPSEVSVKKGKTVDSPYSNTRFSGVKHVTMNYNRGVYSGYVGIDSGTPFGYGSYKKPDGYIYEGEWSDGNYNGYGKETWSDGSSYEGYFVDDSRSGEGVSIIPNSNIKRIGVFAKGNLVSGKEIIAGKRQSEGTWSQTGRPILVTTASFGGEPVTYGFLDNSGGEGYTTFTYPGGETVKGNFTNGGISVQRGLLGGKYGTESIRNRSDDRKKVSLPTFVFDFIPEQIRMEYGIAEPVQYKYPAMGSRLEFLENHTNQNIYTRDLKRSIQFYGRGTLVPNTREANEFISDKYGDYSYVGETLGFGEIRTPGGVIYKGYILSGSLTSYGYGELFYDKDSEKEWYKGMWWFGKKNGLGVLKYKDGTFKMGVFKDDVLVKAENVDFDLMQETFKTWY
jgi:hypothetical protein